MNRLPQAHHFKDHEVVFWRESWTSKARAFAFKCGPPEGHHTTELLKRFPDWHLLAGHAHPDAASYIVYAQGRVMTGDAGYAGVPMAEHHNTLLIDGRGQANEGKGHDAFADFPYEQLDRIRILEARLGRNAVQIRCDAASAYNAQFGLQSFVRHFSLTGRTIEITDEVSAREPRRFTHLVHADESIRPIGDRRLELRNGAAGLPIEILSPRTVLSRIEPNYLIAPGKPGSVDKGDRQQRGDRLAISAAEPVREVKFHLRLLLP